MIPNTDISFDAALVEVGHSIGTLHTISALMDELNTYSTGASHSADTWKNLSGFTGTNIWHFLQVQSFYDYGDGNIDLNVFNYATEDNQSAANIYYEVHDSGDNVLGSGSTSVTSVPPSSSTTAAITYSGGTPTHVHWRFSTSLGWNSANPE